MQRIDFHRGLRRTRERPLRALAGCAETADSSLVAAHVLLMLALKLLLEMVDHPVVEVLSSQMRVASSGAHLIGADHMSVAFKLIK